MVEEEMVREWWWPVWAREVPVTGEGRTWGSRVK